MGQTAALIGLAALWRARFAAGCADRFVNSQNNIGNAGFLGRASQKITATRTPDRSDKSAFAQFAKKLFQIGQGYFLTVRNIGKRDRPVPAAISEIDHRHDGIAAFCTQLHGSSSYLLIRPRTVGK